MIDKYGLRHSDKCTTEELTKFKADIVNYLKDNSLLNGFRIRAFNSYGGSVRIYTGNLTSRVPLRIRKRLIAYRNPDGTVEGIDQDAITRLGDGYQLWQRHWDEITKTEYHTVFRTDWNNQNNEIADDERNCLRQFLEAKRNIR